MTLTTISTRLPPVVYQGFPLKYVLESLVAGVVFMRPPVNKRKLSNASCSVQASRHRLWSLPAEADQVNHLSALLGKKPQAQWHNAKAHL